MELNEEPEEHKKYVNGFHVAAFGWLIISSVVGIFLSKNASPGLRESGGFLLHAHMALMGFGTMMIVGTQTALAPMPARKPARPGGPAAGLLFPLNAALAVIWAMAVLQARTGGKAFLIVEIAAAAAALFCLAVFAFRAYGKLNARSLAENISLRFFVMSLFMGILAYAQIMHICANKVWPGVLPFSNTLFLRHSYLALSFPISLTIMGAISLPYQQALEAGRLRMRLLWDAQFGVLVFGVFALFFSLLFDIPDMHTFFATLQTLFSAMLLFSIVLLLFAVFGGRAQASSMPRWAWLHYVSAMAYLALAGVPGFGLGYGLEPKSSWHYFFLQAHIHLALIGWAGLGLFGVMHHMMSLEGREAGPARLQQFVLMHAGVVTMLAGILLKSPMLRGAAGALLVAASVMMMQFLLKRDSNTPA